MISLLVSLLLSLGGSVRARSALHVELLALRHQIHRAQAVAAEPAATHADGPPAVGLDLAGWKEWQSALEARLASMANC